MSHADPQSAGWAKPLPRLTDRNAADYNQCCVDGIAWFAAGRTERDNSNSQQVVSISVHREFLLASAQIAAPSPRGPYLHQSPKQHVIYSSPKVLFWYKWTKKTEGNRLIKTYMEKALGLFHTGASTRGK